MKHILKIRIKTDKKIAMSIFLTEAMKVGLFGINEGIIKDILALGSGTVDETFRYESRSNEDKYTNEELYIFWVELQFEESSDMLIRLCADHFYVFKDHMGGYDHLVINEFKKGFGFEIKHPYMMCDGSLYLNCIDGDSKGRRAAFLGKELVYVD